MTKRRVLMIGVDGYEASLGDAMMAKGQLPALKSLRERSARFLLDHGIAKRTGLAWEHVSSGLAPGEGGRWAAVDFDPLSYAVRQLPTSLTPFVTDLSARTVVFDAPYFDLGRAHHAQGLVSWGAHDPGVAASSRPVSLQAGNYVALRAVSGDGLDLWFRLALCKENASVWQKRSCGRQTCAARLCVGCWLTGCRTGISASSSANFIPQARRCGTGSIRPTSA